MGKRTGLGDNMGFDWGWAANPLAAAGNAVAGADFGWISNPSANMTFSQMDGLGVGGGGGVGGISGSNRFAASNPTMMTREYGPQIDEMQRRQQEVYAQQQSLAQALLAQSQGQGPNPAMAMLNQQTGQNIAGQGALMAGQRGASANPGMLARQIAMQGSGIQQNAVGQAAALQAQQQLSAQQALMQQQNAMNSGALQGEGNQLGAMASQNATGVTGQLGAQGINANVAAGNQTGRNQMMGGLLQGGAMAGMMAMSDARQKTGAGPADMDGFLDSLSPQTYQYKNPDMAGAAPGQRYGVMAQDVEKSAPGNTIVQDTPQGKMMDPVQGLGVALAALGALNKRVRAMEGGQNMAQGGMVQPLPSFAAAMDTQPIPLITAGGGANPYDMSRLMGAAGGQKKVEGYSGTMMMPATGQNPNFLTASQGAVVPGKAQYSGDTEKNDKVPAMLSPGEVVIPRSIAQGPNAPQKAAEFMKHLRSPRGGYGDVVKARMACGGRVR